MRLNDSKNKEDNDIIEKIETMNLRTATQYVHDQMVHLSSTLTRNKEKRNIEVINIMKNAIAVKIYNSEKSGKYSKKEIQHAYYFMGIMFSNRDDEHLISDTFIDREYARNMLEKACEYDKICTTAAEKKGYISSFQEQFKALKQAYTPLNSDDKDIINMQNILSKTPKNEEEMIQHYTMYKILEGYKCNTIVDIKAITEEIGGLMGIDMQRKRDMFHSRMENVFSPDHTDINRLYGIKINDISAMAFDNLMDIEGYGYFNISDNTANNIKTVAEISAMIAAGVAIGVVCAPLSVGAAMVIGASSMTALEVMSEGYIYESSTEFAYDIVEKQIKNIAFQGAFRALQAGRVIFSTINNSEIAATEVLKKSINGGKQWIELVNKVDETMPKMSKIGMGAGEGVVDHTLISSPIDAFYNSYKDGTSLKNEYYNAVSNPLNIVLNVGVGTGIEAGMAFRSSKNVDGVNNVDVHGVNNVDVHNNSTQAISLLTNTKNNEQYSLVEMPINPSDEYIMSIFKLAEEPEIKEYLPIDTYLLSNKGDRNVFMIHDINGNPVGGIVFIKLQDEVEIRYALSKEHSGIMTDAVKNSVEWMFKNTDTREITAYVEANNNKSTALLSRSGFEKVEDLEGDSVWKIKNTVKSISPEEFREIQANIDTDPKETYTYILHKYKDVPEVRQLIINNIPKLQAFINRSTGYAYEHILHPYKDVPEVLQLIIDNIPKLQKHIKYNPPYAYAHILHQYKDVPEVRQLIIDNIEELIKDSPKYAYAHILHQYKDVPEVRQLIIDNIPKLQELIKVDPKYAYEGILHKYKDVPEARQLIIDNIPKLGELIKVDPKYAYEYILPQYKDVPEVYNINKHASMYIIDDFMGGYTALDKKYEASRMDDNRYYNDSEIPKIKPSEAINNYIKDIATSPNEAHNVRQLIAMIAYAKTYSASKYNTTPSFMDVYTDLYKELERIKPILLKGKDTNIPEGLRVSMGIEYEYGDVYNSNNDGVEATEYGKSIGLDVYHYLRSLQNTYGIHGIIEYNSSPTTNPYMLMAQLYYMQEAHLLDFNFDMLQKKEAINNDKTTSRGIHMTVGGDRDINSDMPAIHEIIMALSGFSAYYRGISTVEYSKRQMIDDIHKKLLNGNDMYEHRNFDVIYKEQFERLIMSTYYNKIGQQALQSISTDNIAAINMDIIDKSNTPQHIKDIAKAYLQMNNSIRTMCQNELKIDIYNNNVINIYRIIEEKNSIFKKEYGTGNVMKEDGNMDMMYSNTTLPHHEQEGASTVRHKQSLFDNNGEERRGYYTVQGQDEGYVFHKIQQEILTYNASVEHILKQYKGAK